MKLLNYFRSVRRCHEIMKLQAEKINDQKLQIDLLLLKLQVAAVALNEGANLLNKKYDIEPVRRFH